MRAFRPLQFGVRNFDLISGKMGLMVGFAELVCPDKLKFR
jgi:hypothetical protein